MVSLLMFAPLSLAAQKINIEIVNLTWIGGAGHIPSFHAQAVLADGSHAMLICRADEKGCDTLSREKIQDSGCDREHMVVTCSATDLGYFPARREGKDVVWIYVPSGKRKYRIVGSW